MTATVKGEPIDTPLTDADVARLVDFADQAVGAARGWLPGPCWPRGWQSQAEREVNNTEVSGDGSPWGDRPVLAAYSTTAMFLHAAEESLNAMGASLSTATTPFVPGILARATIEATPRCRG